MEAVFWFDCIGFGLTESELHCKELGGSATYNFERSRKCKLSSTFEIT